MYNKGVSLMPGAGKLIERILDEARQQAQHNIDRAEKEAADIYNTARNEADMKQKGIIERAQKDASEKRKRLIAYAELEARKQKLQAKQEMVEEAFEQAISRLSTLPAEQYGSILADMVLDVVKTGNEEIIVSNEDKNRLGPGFIETVNQMLKDKGIAGSIKLSGETREMRGGFILKAGDVEINNSFDTILRMKRDELEADVVRTLFGEGV